MGAVNGFCGDFMFQKFHVIHLNLGDGLMSMYLSSSFRRQKRGSVDGIAEGIRIFFIMNLNLALDVKEGSLLQVFKRVHLKIGRFSFHIRGSEIVWLLV